MSLNPVQDVQAEFMRHFQTLAAQPDKRIYAVMDGALIEDLPDKLEQGEFVHRSLYRNDTEANLVTIGPWLVNPYYLTPEEEELDLSVFDDLDDDDLSQENLLRRGARYQQIVDEAFARGDETDGGLIPPEPKPRPANLLKQLDKIVALAEGKSAVVSWIGNASLTEEALWKHLRTINRALIPVAYANPDEQFHDAMMLEDRRTEDGYEAVIFRHWDGNVLSEAMPVLDAAQFVRFFGPVPCARPSLRPWQHHSRSVPPE